MIQAEISEHNLDPLLASALKLIPASSPGGISTRVLWGRQRAVLHDVTLEHGITISSWKKIENVSDNDKLSGMHYFILARISG